MRRKDREVTEREKILDIIRDCDCMRVGMIEGDEVYIVPVNFGFSCEDSKVTLYFHGAQAGRKYELLKNGSKVGFEMDFGHQLLEDSTACNFSYKYRSVIGTGRASVVLEDEKAEALRTIVRHYTASEYSIPESTLSKVCVYKIDVDTMSGKEHV